MSDKIYCWSFRLKVKRLPKNDLQELRRFLIHIYASNRFSGVGKHILCLQIKVVRGLLDNEYSSFTNRFRF